MIGVLTNDIEVPDQAAPQQLQVASIGAVPALSVKVSLANDELILLPNDA